MASPLSKAPFVLISFVIIVYWIVLLILYLSHVASGATTLGPQNSLALTVTTLAVLPFVLLAYLLFEYRYGTSLSGFFPTHKMRDTPIDVWRMGVFLQSALATVIVVILLDIFGSWNFLYTLTLDSLPLFTPLTKLQILLSAVAMVLVNIILFVYALVGPFLYTKPTCIANHDHANEKTG